MKNIAFLVLAAGKSSRMNSIKQLEKINNKHLLEITLDKIKEINSKNIFCVLGANSDKIKSEISNKNVHFIENKNFETGLSSSIVSGLTYFKKQQLNFDRVFVLLGDQPAIETSYLKTMLNLSQKKKEIIIASSYEKKIGVPVIFPKKYFSNLLLIKGDKGAKEFINEKRSEVLCPKITTNFFDIDTKEDLSHFKKSILK